MILNLKNLKNSSKQLLGNIFSEEKEKELISVYEKHKYIIERGIYKESTLEEFDQALENCGVECIKCKLYYSNSGDTYNTTILYYKNRYRICDWGTIVESSWVL